MVQRISSKARQRHQRGVGGSLFGISRLAMLVCFLEIGSHHAYIVPSQHNKPSLSIIKNSRLSTTRYPEVITTSTSTTLNNNNNNNRNTNRISLTTKSLKSSSSTTSTSLYNSNLNGDLSIEDLKNLEPKVYPQRWVQLGYLSVLALLSDWICFAVAASPSTFEAAYPGHSAASIIDMFLFSNVLSCFLVTDIVAKFGLSKAIKGAAGIMTAGCLLRSGASFLGPLISSANAESLPSIIPASDDGLVSYPFLVAGTILVGIAQPFFQCTPPMLSATWFASDERATSTAVALNFNQIGIATAFLVGGEMATTAPGMSNYFGLISVICAVVTLGTYAQFEEKPPSPPSTSEIEKLINGETEPPFIESVKKLFGTKGFSMALTAFICSISITNIVGAFIDEVLERGGIVDQNFIDFSGAGFEIAILLGGIIIGGYVDKTKKYKDVTLACLLTTMFLVIPLGLTDHAIGNEPLLLLAALLGLGMAAGPIQPINAELAVDVTYPSDETAVESVQQIGGNLVSALLVPVAEIAARQDYQLLPSVPALASDIRGDVLLLFGLALVTFAYFTTFDAPLRRTIADCGDDGTCSVPELNKDNDIILEQDGKSDLFITPEQTKKLEELSKIDFD
eukprot:CAMPEP_0178955764 /NCGR_PEP_ID=MMETSP0789-20121207/9805_1 /TAXON_ID=3005 /ORGANISM="Rhizosolenia setigera, Strain CCMP 1694" /LENGTH=622 /DNA_ID=CAMNT_0020637469 /DNA_START=169 /DNA_END=2037 /DNA_ORIENTATION=+